MSTVTQTKLAAGVVIVIAVFTAFVLILQYLPLFSIGWGVE
ncbi:MAG TPA: hypothetical protein VFY29_19220 [Terriglobia bacterium]|nr:hypothetical protein [Terriglobia bacterium]